jgi:TonB family protein
MVIPETTENPNQANEPELNLLLPKETLEVPLWKSLFSSIDAALFPKKESPLVFTGKPVEIGELLGDGVERPWYRSICTNLRDALFPPEQPSLQLTSKPVEGRNELDDALALPWYRSIFANIQDALFSQKLPPLKLSSKPVPVPDIWGFYDHRKLGALASISVHVVFIPLIIGRIIGERHSAEQSKVQARVMPLSNDNDILVLPPSKTGVGGGGGGGDRDKLASTKGKLPKSAMQQFTPPIRNQTPKLPMDPTVVVPPEIKLAPVNLPNLGDPMAMIPHGPLSNGTGSGGGIGSGFGGGVGSGEGSGVGPGSGGGIGGGVFRVGGGISVPRAIYDPDPEYSEEARNAKYQGTVVLQIVAGADGLPRDIQIRRSLGLGLDEKAIEAVKKWRFEPAKKDGRAVAVLVNIEVNFRLH